MTALAVDLERDYVEVALLYMEDVLEGRIPACNYLRLACQRQLNDLKRSAANDPEFPYVFDVTAASRVCRFVELLPHIKGKWARRKELIFLEPWQVFILTCVFGWLHKETGLRRFANVYKEVARKNAKTTVAAGVLLFMLTADGEAGAECYTAATKKEQAKIPFAAAREMAKRSPSLRAQYGLIAYETRLAVPSENSEAKPLDAKGSTQDGLNVHCNINDELHAWPNRELYEVLESGRGSRDQSLEFNITTAGFDRSSICYETRTYGIRVLEGRVIDESMFVIIFTLDKDDDPFDEANWPKANPNLGISVNVDDMRKAARQAKEVASKRNGFLTKRLNIWCNSASSWMDMPKWDAAADPSLSLEQMRGRECFAALDLAVRKDICSRILLFPDGQNGVAVLARHYVPSVTVDLMENASYMGWVEEGWLTVTDGAVINQEKVKQDLYADLEVARCQEVVFDRWQGAKLMGEMIEDGLTVVDLGNTVANMSEPMKELENLTLDSRLRHQGDPILDWMISNVCAFRDEKSNIFPRKETKDSKNKIDGVVALIMALNRFMALRDEGDGTYLEESELVVLD